MKICRKEGEEGAHMEIGRMNLALKMQSLKKRLKRLKKNPLGFKVPYKFERKLLIAKNMVKI